MKKNTKTTTIIAVIALAFCLVSISSACTASLRYDKVEYSDGKTYLNLGSYPRSEASETVSALLESLYQTDSLPCDGTYYALDGKRYTRVLVENDYVEEDTSDEYFFLFTQYTPGTVHWYEVEPIAWRLMNVQNGYAVLFSAELIDARAYSDETTEKGWLWENSDLRNWLNGDFLATAFDNGERKLLKETESPCYYISNPGRIKYEREYVKDLVRIPEWREMLLPEHFEDDMARIAHVTDYARAHGGACVSEYAIRQFDVVFEDYVKYVGSGIYWLSDTEYNSNHVYIVYEYGNVFSYKYMVRNRTVRPAVCCRYNAIKNYLYTR